jgi:hypothetical protein
MAVGVWVFCLSVYGLRVYGLSFTGYNTKRLEDEEEEEEDGGWRITVN